MRISRFIGISLAAACLLACAVEPSAACQAYVACQQAYDEATGTGPVDTAQYEAEGACWDDAGNGAQCTADCEVGLSALAEAAEGEGLDLPACAPVQSI